jgi:hypothetical protein
MKHHLILCLFICYLSVKASAQVTVTQVLKGRANAEEPSLLAKDAIKLVGKDVYVCDMIDSYKAINDSLKLLYIGKSSDSKLTVVLQGHGVHFNPSDYTLSKIHITGKVILYNGKPAIVVTDDHQLGTRIEI